LLINLVLQTVNKLKCLWQWQQYAVIESKILVIINKVKLFCCNKVKLFLSWLN
jgi:hypothetical protein